jgi:hypothetical protein
MSNDTNTNTSNRPTHTAYSVRKYKKNGEYKSQYNAIGAAWQHGDGEGFDIILEAFPVNGRVTLRKPKPKAEQPEQAEQA